MKTSYIKRVLLALIISTVLLSFPKAETTEVSCNVHNQVSDIIRN